MATSALTVGWREWVALPELGIPAIKAKLDTGARTSALHTFQIDFFHDRGSKHVRFGIHPIRKRLDIEIFCEAEVTDFRSVTDSGGHRNKRYIITTPVAIAGESWPIEVSLASREKMLFRMLIGRTAMLGRLIVDPNRSYTTGRQLRKVYPKASVKQT